MNKNNEIEINDIVLLKGGKDEWIVFRSDYSICGLYLKTNPLITTLLKKDNVILLKKNMSIEEKCNHFLSAVKQACTNEWNLASNTNTVADFMRQTLKVVGEENLIINSLRRNLLKVDAQILDLGTQIKNTYALYDDARLAGAEEQMLAIKKQIEEYERDVEVLKIEARGLAQQVFGEVTMESIGLQTKSHEETKKSAKNKDEIIKIKSLATEIRLQKYALPLQTG